MKCFTAIVALATGALAVDLKVGKAQAKVEVSSRAKASSGTKEVEKPMTAPISFHQKLMVCNAYPGGPAKIRRNGVELKSKEALPFSQCRYVDGKIYAEDRISFQFNEGVEGTFEVDELPKSDSVLLLIVQKRDSSATDDLLAFQSFAFPSSAQGGNDAQVAFLNAVADDHETSLQIAEQGKKVGSAREETVLFNRVYAIENGQYDVAMPALQKKLNGHAKVGLQAGQDYVVLKTGTKGHTQLMVFPAPLVPTLFSQFASLFYVAGVAAPVVLLAAAGSYYYKGKGAEGETA